MFSRFSLSACIAIFITFFTFAQAAPSPSPYSVKGLGVNIANADATDIVANRYIVVYNNNASDERVEHCQSMIASSIAKRGLNARALDGRQMSNTISPFSMQGWRGTILDGDDATMLQISAMADVSFLWLMKFGQ